MTNILIADRCNLIRLGLTQIIKGGLSNYCIIDYAYDGAEVLQKVAVRMYDIIVTELYMSGTKGIPLIRQILSANPRARIIVLTENSEEQFAELCFHAGARAFVHKGASELELETTIRAIIHAPFYISNKQKDIFSTSLLLKQTFRKQYPDLSEKELEVARLLLFKLNVREIAHFMGISLLTVKECQKRVYKKLNINSQMQLANVAKICDVVNARDFIL